MACKQPVAGAANHVAAVLAPAEAVNEHHERFLGSGRSGFGLVEGGDEAARVDRLLTDVLQAYPDVVGVYSLGGGNRGLRKALDRIDAADRPRVVVHELTEQSRTALQDGVFDAVLQQDIHKEVTSALVIMRNLIEAVPTDPRTGLIHTEIFLRDNLP